MSDAPHAAPTSADPFVLRHLRFGWWSLLAFLTLGLVLEAFHGLKTDWYLNVASQTRRLMFTLAHSHGALLGLVHLGFAFTLTTGRGAAPGSWRRVASLSLVGASLLLPGGFFLGGIWFYGGDPGRGILLVPVGGILLFAAVLLVAWNATRKRA